MSPSIPLLAAVLLLCVGAAPGGDRGPGQRRPPPPSRFAEQDVAFAGTRDGRIRPLREIEGRVVPRMYGADYLGPEFDPGSGTYRLKFMRGGSVIWIDVDGRTGAIIGRQGN